MSAITKKSPKTKTKEQIETPSTVAFHEKDAEGHVIGIGNLRVILCHEDGLWFAQGLEIDYAADGNSRKEAKKNFEQGLEATIDQHLKVYGNIKQILIPAPAEIWQELGAGGKLMRYSQVTFHERQTDALRRIPYSGINFIEPADEVAA